MRGGESFRWCGPATRGCGGGDPWELPSGAGRCLFGHGDAHDGLDDTVELVEPLRGEGGVELEAPDAGSSFENDAPSSAVWRTSWRCGVRHDEEEGRSKWGDGSGFKCFVWKHAHGDVTKKRYHTLTTRC